METVAEIVRGVAALLLLSACLDLLLPSGELAKFSRFALGLLLIAVILQPLSALWETWKQHPDIPWPQSEAREDPHSYRQQGEALAVYLQGQAYDQYLDQLSRQIQALVCLNEGVEQARARPEIDAQSGVLTGLQVNVLLREGAVLDRQKLSASLSGFFAVAEENITISEVSAGEGRGR
ncbi:MAG: stage III sporulation protein AF [Firmicutes bacterium]|nr:stage III sporulation protein AF [Bacillota bacterium]